MRDVREVGKVFDLDDRVVDRGLEVGTDGVGD